MQDVIDTVDQHIEELGGNKEVGRFTELSKRWAGHCLETYTDNLLTKGLAVAKALAEFDAEMLDKD